MTHHHSHKHFPHLNRAFTTGIVINILFIIAEAFYGYISCSMALYADAGHNFSDVMALVFAWIGVLMARRKPTQKFTYGLRRSTILIALLNTLLLLLAVIFIIIETIGRLGKNIVAVDANSVIIVAGAGIIVNAVTAWLFYKGKKNDLNIRSAFIHFIADALVSVGVVVAGILIKFTGLLWIDSAVSFIIIAVILYSTYHLLIDSINLALDAVPQNIDITIVRNYLEQIPEVSGIHDLHIWALSTTDTALTVHLVTETNTDAAFIGIVQKELHDRFGISHSTIQVEFGNGFMHCDTDCR